jgi:hypothetical protein
MRKVLSLLVLFMCALVLGFASRASSQPGKTASAGNPSGEAVKGEGCLRAGTEAGCMILTTTDKKHKYSLHFGGNEKPAVGIMISFEGATGDVDTCMQGTPVNVTKWTALKSKCPAETK